MQHLLRERQREEEGLSWSRVCGKVFGLIGFALKQVSVSQLLPKMPEIKLPKVRKASKKFAPRSRFQELIGLSLDSAIALRKVQGNLREQWATAIEPPMQPHQGKASRWMSAAHRKVFIQPQQVPASAGRVNANGHEDIRGLDDIFPAPITDFFMENAQPFLKNMQAATSAGIAEAQALLKKARRPKPLLDAAEKSEIQHQAAVLLKSSEAESKTLNDSIESAKSWLKTLENRHSPSEQSPLPEAAPETTTAPPPSRPAFIPPSLIEAPLPAPMSASKQASRVNLSPDADSTELRKAAPQPALTASGKMAQGQPEPVKSGIREQLQLDQDLESDLSSFDYLVRNNRILTESISNLADRYFQKAALDEEASYY